MRYENIPYRRYWYPSYRLPRRRMEIVFTAAGKRVMARIGRAMKAGKAVTFTHQIVERDDPPFRGAVYDTISATIED